MRTSFGEGTIVLTQRGTGPEGMGFWFFLGCDGTTAAVRLILSGASVQTEKRGG
ncbi:hypothetical protein DPMN_008973 [Dreissena polymorpha]|uniref:Uncharacterized protein n=1 Tax=Dreissena polymorpha TaxID=45954 RepID=A0A9D4RXJ5_DREPO|nr:hypothetical protein DPMN_008973 [Dreissena polymorpha]